MSNYAQYYRRIIQAHTKGLKLVVGGTGLGKTRGAREAILTSPPTDPKSLYIANRKQLIEEMATQLDPTTFVIVPRDLEAVQLTLRGHRAALYALLSDRTFKMYVDSYNAYNSWKVDIAAARQACKDLEEFSTRDPYIQRRLEEMMDGQARRVLDVFKAALFASGGKRGDTSAYQDLIDHPVIQSLFPCIAFKRKPHLRLMLITLHKAFYGFFDGKKTLSLTGLRDEEGGYHIYLDEFDFLENDLVDLICRSREISDPFLFVELFYRTMARHKLPLEQYPFSVKPIRDRIVKITELVEQFEDEHLRFPELNQFTSLLTRDGGYKGKKGVRRSPAIFRTQHTISTSPLYLYQTERSFELVARPDPVRGKPYSALRFFGTVSYACQLALSLFKDLEKEDPVIHREMVRQCFRGTDFPEQMARLSHYARIDETPLTTRASLLEGGYSLYDIKDLQQITDREEVEVRHYGMSLTPEAILYTLAQHNLVFGLSATIDIPRQVHNFDLDWLEQKQVLIKTDDEDRAIVRQLNLAKADARKNHIHLDVLHGLDPADSYQQRLDQFLQSVSTEEDFGNETGGGHLKQRVRLFFSVLLWIAKRIEEKPDGDYTSLLFFTSFKQIKFVFDRYPTPDDGLFAITKREETHWFEVYDIFMRERHFTVVFYNAQLSKAVRQSKEAQRAFDSLFWEPQPVIVVTQYLTAGNGVNLQYLPHKDSDEEDRRDFTIIGLLERPYYYFSPLDDDQTAEEQAATLKENIWYLAKLFFSKTISEQQFRQLLSTLNHPDPWNNLYRSHADTQIDALYNDISTFIQALGRIERTWKKTPDQTVLLSPEVDLRLQMFCSPAFDEVREGREAIISENLRQVFEQASARRSHIARQVRRDKDSRLWPQNEQCRSAIGQLLVRIAGLRQGKDDQEARKLWEHLRIAALKHDFKDETLHRFACVADSPYYQKGLLVLTPQMDCLPVELRQHDSFPWDMNILYRTIRLNPVIFDHFKGEGYELSFDHPNKEFFTPYCYQAILAGAIGEEAIRALLLHEGISFEPMPNRLFEAADMKINGRPWYIDGKHYSDWTMGRFALPPTDPAWHPKLNEEHLKRRAQEKLEAISCYHGEPGKLIYINLTSHYPRPLDYYTCDFRPVESYAEASIIVVQGALQQDAAGLPQHAFELFCRDLKRA
jgi:hypothetical protein